MSRLSGQKLSPAAHEEAAVRAYELSLKGYKHPHIAAELGVSRNTVSLLIREERQRRRKERPECVADALAAYDEIIRASWSFLEQIKNPSSYTVPALLNAAIHAQQRKDLINGVEAPKKREFQHRHLDLSKISDEELDAFQDLVDRIQSQTEEA